MGSFGICDQTDKTVSDNVLFVDDEKNVRSALGRVFMDTDVRVLSAPDAASALALLEREDIAVVVSDNHMPGMKGVDLLSAIRRRSPDTIRVLMTGQADLQTALEAINNGEVYRFLLKPWDNAVLRHTVEDGVHRHRMLRGLKGRDERTLLSLAQTVELKDPYTRGHCDRVAAYALAIARADGREGTFLQELKHGSWLHDCGKIGLPDAVLNKPGRLDETEFEMIRKHPEWGAQVAVQAGLPITTINVIRYHHERWDGAGYSAGLSKDAIPPEARIVALADVYDAVTTERPYKTAIRGPEALQIMKRLQGQAFDPTLTDVFLGLIERGEVAVPVA